MKKLPVILTSAALCSVAAFATMPTAYAAEDGTPEKAVEIAKSYLNNELSFTDTKGAWCVKFALKCISMAGGTVAGVSPNENSTTSVVVNMYNEDPESYHSWIGAYWYYGGKTNPKIGTTDDDYTPQVGDLVFFDNVLESDMGEKGPGPDHTGLVIAVEGTGKGATITTIEGNIDDSIVTAQYKDGKWYSGEVGTNTTIVGFGTPKYPTEQMGRDFKKLYPAANILVATKKDFEPKNRKELFAKIATGEWDAVIVGHSQFDRMGLSKDRMEAYMQAEIADLRSQLEEARGKDGSKSFSVKEIEKTIARYEKKLKEGQDKVSKDDYIDFEEMGFDKLFVDECHLYKNLGTATKMSNVAGIGTTGSGKAAELLMKTRYFDELTGGKGMVFASGTPNATPS